ncbi:alpha/beta hydrolase [Actinomarinicola tropica]|uniref:Alpha/beta fold hydrolase n=1 Tax=Actinomarinicola tropica TaxID=2789776 RepID=A0A5Q2RSE8_9ACTN|nr:alpha/beta hydrolase [Actinomarinicola tropica]QGG96125.1 alpha/beta fold hydrolase [Actinomarinicola tropica]
MSHSLRRLSSLLLALLLVASACGTADPERRDLADLVDGQGTSTTTAADDDTDDAEGPPEDVGGGTIEWRDAGRGWQSGTLEVPLDHDDPDGETIELALVRRPADDPDARIGPLLMNPGGPGASGNELALIATYLFPTEVLDRFDIVGFDPRGVAESSPVVCGDDEFLDEYTAFDPVPDSPEEREEAEALIEEFAEGCERESGDLLAHIHTEAVARDMDLIREALGEEQINYLGFSYGTFLGATYIELFPERVRAAVLDGAYSRSLTPEEMAVGQATGFERSIDAFLAWCEPERCDLAADGAPGERLLAILDAIDERPLPTDDGRELTVGLAWTAVIMAMYSPALWPSLDAALVEADDAEDGSALLGLADQYNDRGLDGEYSNSTFAFVAYNCMDDPPLDGAEEEALSEAVLEVAPRIGPLFVELPSPCAHWPVEREDAPTGPFSAPDAPPLLVVATTGDPATPYTWGVQLADELETSVLVTVEGDSHTAYGSGNSCVNELVDSYLIDLEVPDEPPTC